MLTLKNSQKLSKTKLNLILFLLIGVLLNNCNSNKSNLIESDDLCITCNDESINKLYRMNGVSSISKIKLDEYKDGKYQIDLTKHAFFERLNLKKTNENYRTSYRISFSDRADNLSEMIVTELESNSTTSLNKRSTSQNTDSIYSRVSYVNFERPSNKEEIVFFYLETVSTGLISENRMMSEINIYMEDGNLLSSSILGMNNDGDVIKKKVYHNPSVAACWDECVVELFEDAFSGKDGTIVQITCFVMAPMCGAIFAISCGIACLFF